MSLEGVVCVPTRGLWHSRTAEAIEENLEGRGRQNWKIRWTHDLPIPEAQNDVTARALALDPQFVLYVEEDIVMPPLALDLMIAHAAELPVVFADYTLMGGITATRRNRKGKVIFGGMGCMLVRREVFAAIPQPWFQADTYWYSDATDEWALRHKGNRYGGQDIGLFAALHKAGIEALNAPVVCAHLQVVKYGQRGTNSGCHEIKPISATCWR
jgi:hypothetical protein